MFLGLYSLKKNFWISNAYIFNTFKYCPIAFLKVYANLQTQEQFVKTLGYLQASWSLLLKARCCFHQPGFLCCGRIYYYRPLFLATFNFLVLCLAGSPSNLWFFLCFFCCVPFPGPRKAGCFLGFRLRQCPLLPPHSLSRRSHPLRSSPQLSNWHL